MVSIDDLRHKWHMLPIPGIGNFSSMLLLTLSDEIFTNMWEISNNYQKEKYWYRQYYDENFWKDKIVIDVGCGFCTDSLAFAMQGAKVIFADIVEENLDVAKRLCKLYGISGHFVKIKSAKSLKYLPELDVVLALGSLHHAPKEIVQPEMHELCRHLKVGGRWLQLAYPYDRWYASGCPLFEKFGIMTDGEGTPWAEWYDAKKLMKILKPYNFELKLELPFAERDNYHQFIWIDLERN